MFLRNVGITYESTRCYNSKNIDIFTAVRTSNLKFNEDVNDDYETILFIRSQWVVDYLMTTIIWLDDSDDEY
jgi:hypothetical protein